GAPRHQCRFFQSYFVDEDGEDLDQVPAAYGFCVPRGDQHGNCREYSLELILRTYDDAGGGTAGQEAIAALCASAPGRCSNGCTGIATADALEAAYCAANPASIWCSVD
ncbi:MAG TPA: hypothetical protein VFU04_03050, partial [Solirubrobacterales bacterium]|nr:hypothetical protein [Solirubrobacterales bacterium]